MDKSPDQKKAEDSRHFVIFLPFLRMRTGLTVAGVEFLPLRDDDDNVPAALETAVAPLERIPFGFRPRLGSRIRIRPPSMPIYTVRPEKESSSFRATVRFSTPAKS